MRLTLILAVAAILIPAALTARPIGTAPSGIEATDLSAAKKKKKATARKEEYLKAAPGTGPSGPKTKY